MQCNGTVCVGIMKRYSNPRGKTLGVAKPQSRHLVVVVFLRPSHDIALY